LAGCSLEAKSQSSTESATAVSLSGQSATSAPRTVTSGPGLPFGEKALDEGAGDRRAPVLRTNHPLHDDAVSLQQETFRHAGGLIPLLNAGRAILQNVKRQVHRLAEVPDVSRVSLVDAHGGDLEAARRERVVEPLHRRHLDLAWLAPGRPDVH